jgi:hypothetical protein
LISLPPVDIRTAHTGSHNLGTRQQQHQQEYQLQQQQSEQQNDGKGLLQGHHVQCFSPNVKSTCEYRGMTETKIVFSGTGLALQKLKQTKSASEFGGVEANAVTASARDME